jgi:hypothetical protein
MYRFTVLILHQDNLFRCQGLIDTVIFHVNALTGEDALGKSPADTILQGVDLISGLSLGAYQLPGHSKAVIVLDEFCQVRFVQIWSFSFNLLILILGIRLPRYIGE